MSSSTTIIFVPGAWHTPDGFKAVASHLSAAGYNTDFVSLASVGPSTHLQDFRPDVDIIRKHITKATDAGQKVVLVMHSYGSIPGTEAAYNLDQATLRSNGKSGGVSHLFYMCAFIIPAGNTLIEAFGGNNLPWFDVSEDKTEVNPLTPEDIFYNDLAADEVQRHVAALKPHSYQTMHSKLEHATWQTIPSTYLYCTKDAAIPLVVQEMMVNEFAKGTKINTDKVEGSHSPHLSLPEETAKAIQRAAELES